MRNKDCRKKCITPNPAKLLNEGPDVIGIISTALENGGSIDTAIRDVAANGPPISSKLFSEIVMDADTRVDADMQNALLKAISQLPEECNSYCMAVRMAVSAHSVSDRNERARILKEASGTSLEGLRMAGKSYASSLNTPCMVVFSIGIMIPMILMSILPMVSMGGLFDSSVFNQRDIALITLILIPASILMVVTGIGNKNPLGASKTKTDLKPIFPIFSAIPIFLLSSELTEDIAVRICISFIAAGVVTSVSMVRGGRAISKNRKMAATIENALFEIGNRLLCGVPFERSVEESLTSRKDTEILAVKLRNELSICRGDVESALTNTFSPVSCEANKSILEIYHAATKNPLDGGKLAVTLGKQMNDRGSIRRQIGNELKSMTDTMFGTATIFAPLVLGLSVSMMKPMQAISGLAIDGSTTVTISVYLCELCAIIALLLSFVDGKNSCREIVSRFSSMVPVTLSVFLVTLQFGI